MNGKIANPGALGLGGFALTTFLLSVINAGIMPRESGGVVIPMALFYGGLAQILAGMWEFKTGNIFGATCFTSFGRCSARCHNGRLLVRTPLISVPTEMHEYSRRTSTCPASAIGAGTSSTDTPP